MVDLDATATFQEAPPRGHCKATSFDMLNNRAPKLFTAGNSLQHGVNDENIVGKHWRHTQAGVNVNVRKALSVQCFK